MNEIDILIVVSKLKRIGINISLHNKSNDHREEKKEQKKLNKELRSIFVQLFLQCKYI